MISAVVLAGGESKRMGQPKMLMPWGESTVLAHVIGILKEGGVDEILVVTGAGHAAVESLCAAQKVRTAFNAGFSQSEMLGSLQTGLRAMTSSTQAALVTLGDQPQIQAETARAVVAAWRQSKSPLVVPSYRQHRGHPWVLGRSLWNEVLAMQAPESPREFLTRHSAEIHYVVVDSATVLQDIDTPEDYQQARP